MGSEQTAGAVVGDIELSACGHEAELMKAQLPAYCCCLLALAQLI